MDDVVEVKVLNEEIIVHPWAEQRARTFLGEARIMGKVMIDDQTYSFERVIQISFTKDHKRGENAHHHPD